ncbi:MAG TPA: class I SAM-dependent methyltransferase [Bacteroidales bacterium]|nr:class I SAM-dependent methyltransferase [Bacteroidales bacterium]
MVKSHKMTQLYSTLARVYHEMYQHVFDYDKEYSFYDAILKSNGCKKILEVGCGSGMLAKRFMKNGYDYLGLDLFSEMLDIARAEVKSEAFIQCDMRKLPFDREFDSVLITGRSLAYVTDNKGIIDTFTGVHRSLKDKGLFVFGVFEANGIFDNFSDFEQIIDHNDKHIRRISKLKKNLETGWTYDWYAKYLIEENGKVSEYNDLTTLRAFTKDEILLFLKLTGFKVKEIIEEEKTITLITEKK